MQIVSSDLAQTVTSEVVEEKIFDVMFSSEVAIMRNEVNK
jgi:hypothetical protein